MTPRDRAAAAFGWWQALQPDLESKRPGDRAALAQLRRCSAVVDAMQHPAALRLFRGLDASSPCELPVVGLAAAVLAHVRKDAAGLSVARLIGPDSIETPQTALLKPLRFRRLMEASELDERLAAFRRLAALAGGALPVRDLAAALLDWSDLRRTRWVYDYWNVAPPSSPDKDALP